MITNKLNLKILFELSILFQNNQSDNTVFSNQLASSVFNTEEHGFILYILLKRSFKNNNDSK